MGDEKEQIISLSKSSKLKKLIENREIDASCLSEEEYQALIDDIYEAYLTENPNWEGNSCLCCICRNFHPNYYL